MSRSRSTMPEFLSTPSARRATQEFVEKHTIDGISIHALREEGDLAGEFVCLDDAISIHALREEGDEGAGLTIRALSISIHALREEGDRLPRSWHLAAANFYPRPPRGGRPLSFICYV